MPDRFDVFLSHNQHDKPFVRALCDLLTKQGLSVFLDERAVRPGDEVFPAVADAVRYSRYFLLILSQASVSSDWVKRETELAHWMKRSGSGRRLIPVRIDATPSDSMPAQVRTVSAIELADPLRRTAQLRLLLHELGKPTVSPELDDELRQLGEILADSQPRECRVSSLEDTMDWGWDRGGIQLLQHLIALDYATLPGLPPRHEGSPEQWGPVFMRHPETWRLLTTEPTRIVGYWHFAPLFPKDYAAAREGRLVDSEIDVRRVQHFEIPGQYDIYFVQICLLPEFRKLRNQQKLFRAFFDVLTELSAGGVFVREVAANAYTEDGEALCETFRMDPVGQHAERGTLYAAPIGRLLARPIAAGFESLRSAYRGEGLLQP